MPRFVFICQFRTDILWVLCLNRMLEDLEVGVDHTDNKLSDAMRRMRKFIRQTEGTCCLFNLASGYWFNIWNFFGFGQKRNRDGAS